MLKQFDGFDIDGSLKVGTPVQVTMHSKSAPARKFYGLIFDANPICLKIVYARNHGETIKDAISIDDVINGYTSVEPLIYKDIEER